MSEYTPTPIDTYFAKGKDTTPEEHQELSAFTTELAEQWQQDEDAHEKIKRNEAKNNSLLNRVGRKLGVKAAQAAFDKRAGETTMLVQGLSGELPEEEPKN